MITRHRTWRMRAGIVAVASLAAGSTTRAQANGQLSAPVSSPRAPIGATSAITPGAQYAAGWLHRRLLGADYRDLWITPIQVATLDLEGVAGGLRPTQRGGSMQTHSLRFVGANQREYVFRPLAKDLTRGLSEDLHNTVIGDLIQDQVSAYHPDAAMVVGRLLDATRVRHVTPQLVIMPDDPRLGAFRSEFAGQLGTIEERPDRGWDSSSTSRGALEVISTEKLLERLQRHPKERIEVESYLTARLVDVLIGDRDRHRDQWRWARFADGDDVVWEPIPRDRDMAFARLEGAIPSIVRATTPRLVTFEREYPSMVWLNWNAREIDRRLLSELSKAQWQQTAAALQAAMTDSVLRASIAAMPAAHLRLDGDTLFAVLQTRRDQLHVAAMEYYRVLAREVEITGTQRADRVNVERHLDGSLTVSLAARASPRREPLMTFYTRRFTLDETREIRLYLGDGADSVHLHGHAGAVPRLRVVGGAGNDVVHNALGVDQPWLRVYDHEGLDTLISQRPAAIDRRAYKPPSIARAQDVPRDWGRWSYLMPAASVQTGMGVILGATHTRIGYGFRKLPYAYQSVTRLDGSLAEGRPRLTWGLTLPRENRADAMSLHVTMSGLELLRWYGIGNESESREAREYYRVGQSLMRVEPRWSTALGRSASMSAGLFLLHASTRAERSLVRDRAPYGSGSFAEAGLTLATTVDRRDSRIAPTRGYRFDVRGSITPPLMDARSAYGSVAATVSSYHAAPSPLLPARLAPTIAVRAGGRHALGEFPIHAASFVGGVETLRGWDPQRFAARSSLYGSVESRVTLGRMSLLVPTRVGAMLFTDVARVFADGEQSSRWHSAVGGGVWMAPLVPEYTISVSVARGRERAGWYIANGFAF